MQREAIQLLKDFIAEHAQDEMEFYMGIVTEEGQSFEGLKTISMMPSSWVKC